MINIHSGIFNNVDTVLAFSVSYGAFDFGKTKMELVKLEAFNISSRFSHAFCLCLLYLEFFNILLIAIIKAMMQY